MGRWEDGKKGRREERKKGRREGGKEGSRKSAGILVVNTLGPVSIPSHFQFKPLHIIAIDGEFSLYVFYSQESCMQVALSNADVIQWLVPLVQDPSCLNSSVCSAQ